MCIGLPTLTFKQILSQRLLSTTNRRMDDFDEFGNYIGVQEPVVVQQENIPERTIVPEQIEDETIPMQVDKPNQIILHEDKNYYPSASQVYGQGVETLVEEEDAQPLSVPIVQPIKVPTTYLHSENSAIVSNEFLSALSSHPDSIRNIALVGHLHHGKTSLIDLLVNQSHNQLFSRFTDVHPLEVERGITIKSMPVSLVAPDLKGKSWYLHLIQALEYYGYTRSR